MEHGRANNIKLEKAHGGSDAAVGTTHIAKAKGGGKRSMGSEEGAQSRAQQEGPRLFVEISDIDQHGEEVLSKQLMYCM